MRGLDPFAVIMLGGTALIVIALMLIGAFHPRSGADVLRWRPTRSPEVEAQNRGRRRRPDARGRQRAPSRARRPRAHDRGDRAVGARAPRGAQAPPRGV